MEKNKKTWTEPKLTALVRRKPEEGILQICKGGGQNGPNATGSSCTAQGSNCNVQSSS